MQMQMQSDTQANTDDDLTAGLLCCAGTFAALLCASTAATASICVTAAFGVADALPAFNPVAGALPEFETENPMPAFEAANLL